MGGNNLVILPLCLHCNRPGGVSADEMHPFLFDSALLQGWRGTAKNGSKRPLGLGDRYRQ